MLGSPSVSAALPAPSQPRCMGSRVGAWVRGPGPCCAAVWVCGLCRSEFPAGQLFQRRADVGRVITLVAPRIQKECLGEGSKLKVRGCGAATGTATNAAPPFF